MKRKINRNKSLIGSMPNITKEPILIFGIKNSATSANTLYVNDNLYGACPSVNLVHYTSISAIIIYPNHPNQSKYSDYKYFVILQCNGKGCTWMYRD
jgi:hypothetical protein